MAGQSRTAHFTLDDRAYKTSLAAAVKRIKLETEQDLDRLAHSAVNNTKRYTPVDTGRLRSSYAILEKGNDAFGPYRVVGSRVGYAFFVEHGHRLPNGGFVNPSPHFRPGLLEAVLNWKPGRR